MPLWGHDHFIISLSSALKLRDEAESVSPGSAIRAKQYTNSLYEILHRDNVKSDVTWKFWKTRRYIVVLMAFLGFFNVYGLRVNLSVAIVAMTEKFNVTLENGTVIEDQHFDWDSKQQGLILSSFFYGYIWTQLLGGYLGSKFGGHYVSLLFVNSSISLQRSHANLTQSLGSLRSHNFVSNYCIIK